MKILKSIQQTIASPFVNMGPIRLRQPLPSEGIENVDPFILLHHYGPYAISEFNNPFDLGPHPHRGFEPITLLFQGEQFHRDSLGNEMVVKAGDVQWTTAGHGIVHAEAPTKEFVKKGGTLEGIQLWLNLPAKDKLMPPNYQHLEAAQIPKIFSEDQKVQLNVIAGNQKDQTGLIKTQTTVNVFTAEAQENGMLDVDIPQNHQSLIYVLDGTVLVNDTKVLKKGENQMIVFNQDGNSIHFKAKTTSTILILSGEPILEKVTQYGPYVMNTQTEILEAMRDYQQGKMGHLY
ncbi:pirin family protein [Polaribacter sp.]|jgi:redox-sensitive bicupin YhaK (pirin superfamily)|nr:pirin family protein [Polaribacter sp.]MDA9348879.1 pirin family protein [Polaribacter sp.]MDA9363203.1 pirin family protein [Polaribacter sp.]MDA9977087.1 pirin family protein [Polaribacter sp.]MDB4202749.1 pirin family protein [Polaribacter sp.]